MPREPDRVVDIDVFIVAKTQKAVLVHPVGSPHKEIWIPLSCCSGVGKKGENCCLGVAEWFAEKNNLGQDDWKAIE